MDRKIGLGFGFAIALGVAAPSLAQQAVQWRVEDGGNGHWYAAMQVPSTCDWHDARQQATTLGAHLATITSNGENQFVREVHPGFVWIGLYQDRAAADYFEPNGAWRWVTGEPVLFTAWAGGEPNNYFGNPEDFAHLNTGPTWNDIINPYCWPTAIIEWSADCNGDGIVDYGQILDGTYDDLNSNGVPDCCDAGESCLPCPSDIDENGVTDGIDLAVILGRWGTNPKDYPRADANDDGTVDAGDLSIVLAGWGNCP